MPCDPKRKKKLLMEIVAAKKLGFKRLRVRKPKTYMFNFALLKAKRQKRKA